MQTHTFVLGLEIAIEGWNQDPIGVVSLQTNQRSSVCSMVPLAIYTSIAKDEDPTRIGSGWKQATLCRSGRYTSRERRFNFR